MSAAPTAARGPYPFRDHRTLAEVWAGQDADHPKQPLETVSTRQAEALHFIQAYQSAHGGVSPTFSTLCRGLGLASKHSVHSLLARLERRGLIRRLPNRDQAIEVLRPLPLPRAPDGAPLYPVTING